ncbi:MAG TPA: radical SAM family heme chaperone HemW [Chondromyces sp.]|nr:radical SAM family heme chaperone HemW [Chondromyces sp.]
MVHSAYIHIPFCTHICHYCDFNKVFLKNQPVDEYLQSLDTEMRLTLEEVPVDEIRTIFVGGGTPTSLNDQQLAKLCESIRERLPYEKGEFTFEANPGDLTEEKIKILKEYGVNRLSIGVQSFNDDMLKKIGRTHRSKDVFTTIEQAQKHGFENLSLDLIYALPGQTLDDFRDTLRTALELNLPHYSGYSLIIEPKTVFYNLMQKGQLSLPKVETEAGMYQLLMDEMERYGLHQYEISNFAKKGFESQHNLVYWKNEEYFGFGAGAHAYVAGKRQSNYGPLKKYMEPLKYSKLPIISSHVLSVEEKMEEEMFLGLRTTKGVSISRFREKYQKDPLSLFEQPITEMETRGLLAVQDDYIRLTHEGKFLGNEVFQSFLLTLDQSEN